MEEMERAVSIVIYGDKDHEYIRKGLNDIQEHFTNYKLYVHANNCSGKFIDDIIESLGNAPRDISQSLDNIGYIGGVNYNFSRCRERYFYCMNYDIEISGALQGQAENLLKSNDLVGVCAGALTPQGLGMNEQEFPDIPTQYLSGWFLAVDRENYLRKYGKKFFDDANLRGSYYEDADLSFRIIHSGGRIAKIPGVLGKLIRHFGRPCPSLSPPYEINHPLYNRVAFFKKWGLKLL